jgi:hypothetical protein
MKVVQMSGLIRHISEKTAASLWFVRNGKLSGYAQNALSDTLSG